MGGPPGKQLSQVSKDQCRRVTFSLWRATQCDRSDPPTLADWAKALGLDDASEGAVLARCREIAGVSALDDIPPVAPVRIDDNGCRAEGLTDNLAATVAVLARSGEKVFVRRKSPIVTPYHLQRAVTLILPHDWRYLT